MLDVLPDVSERDTHTIERASVNSSYHLGQVTGLLRLLTEHVASSPRPDAGTTVLEHCQVQLQCLQVSLSVAARLEPRVPRKHGSLLHLPTMFTRMVLLHPRDRFCIVHHKPPP